MTVDWEAEVNSVLGHWWVHWTWSHIDYVSPRVGTLPEQQLSTLTDYLKEMRYMANEANKARGKGKKNAGKLTWLAVQFTSEDQPEVEKWIQDSSNDFLGYVAALSAEGFSFSVKPGNNDDFMSTVIGECLVDGVPRTVGVSAFASTPLDCVGAILFKVFVLLDTFNDVEAYVPSSSARFR